MAETKVRVSSNGIGFFSLLGLTFIILKLCNVITWSWLWVLAPFWMGAAFIVGTLIIMLILAAFIGLAGRSTKRSKYKRW